MAAPAPFFWPRSSPLCSRRRVRGCPFFGRGFFSCPRRPFRLFPRFSLFCLGPRARGFLLFGPVMLVAVSSFAFAHLGAWRPSSAVLRVSCRVNQENAPAERLRAVILAQADDPRFGAAGLLPFRGMRQNVLAIMDPPGKRKSGGAGKKNEGKCAGSGAALPRCISPVARFRAS